MTGYHPTLTAAVVSEHRRGRHHTPWLRPAWWSHVTSRSPHRAVATRT